MYSDLQFTAFFCYLAKQFLSEAPHRNCLLTKCRHKKRCFCFCMPIRGCSSRRKKTKKKTTHWFITGILGLYIRRKWIVQEGIALPNGTIVLLAVSGAQMGSLIFKLSISDQDSLLDLPLLCYPHKQPTTQREAEKDKWIQQRNHIRTSERRRLVDCRGVQLNRGITLAREMPSC